MCTHEIVRYSCDCKKNVKQHKIVRCDADRKPFSSLMRRKCLNTTRPTESVSPNEVCLQCVINEWARKSEGQPVGKQEERNATTKFTDQFSWKLGKLFQRRRREELAARIGRGRRDLEKEAKKFEDVANEVERALASKAGEHPEAEAEIAAVRAQVVAANQAVRVTADRLAAGMMAHQNAVHVEVEDE
ncbi:hypothetical protein LTR09_010670 [Extremus antarcticus]|uniref:Uncharacterized protein n=1 Tax=Extremus antarcticus TaxID=702011 RepID=A0AAJ0DDI9_9PEZI|nr:hypothetical protein LTR09_010670 [Extremus antarcticus]